MTRGNRLLLPAFAILAGCAAGTGPRFSQEVASSFARNGMRRLETPNLEVYYPADQRQTALRTAARLSECVDRLRQLPRAQHPRDKVLAFVTDANFNNAYVQPSYSGTPQHMLLPQFLTLELFNWFDQGIHNVDEVACHEAVHYVQMQEVRGIWRLANLVFGDLFQPNAVMDSWFLEGLATYYEGNLGKASGRPHSPVWRGTFEAALGQGPIDSGDLHPFSRRTAPFSGVYLVGQHFVEWLAQKYGEERLWEVVDLQAGSLIPPLGVTLRFKSIYGLSIGALMDQYAAELKDSRQPRERPPGQQILVPDVGSGARLAVARDGSFAVLSSGLDLPDSLSFYRADGAPRLSRTLAQIFPGRRWVGSGPTSASGMSFTADGRWLFLAMADVDLDGSTDTRVWKVDATSGEVVRIYEPFLGLGGGVSPDGRGFVLVEVGPGRSDLVRLDTETGQRTILTSFPEPRSLGAPAYSPDGTRVAFALSTGEGFDLYLREEDGALRPLTTDHRFNYAPRWINDERLLLTREQDGLAQAEVIEISTGQLSPVTQAPYLALDPAPGVDGRVVFLNRQGWSFSVDQSPLPEAIPVEAQALAPDPELPTGPDQKVPPALEILEDGPYSSFDHLFVPSLRAPTGGVLYVNERLEYWAQFNLVGADRLGFHNWALRGGYDSQRNSLSGGLDYVTALTAPWFLSGRVAAERADEGNSWSAEASASRIFWTTPLFLSFVAIDNAPELSPGLESPGRQRFIGPRIATSYFSGDGTPYAGTQKSLGLSGSITYYPRALGSTVDVADLRGSISGAIPLPLRARHSLALGLRGRVLLGSPDAVLRIGGTGASVLYMNEAQGLPERQGARPSLVMSETLRGYEDTYLFARRTLLGTAEYRYPFIIDQGWASTLYLLPAFFLRQLDLSAFGEGAVTERQDEHYRASAGATLALRFAIGSAPFSIFYQYAHRFPANLGELHLVGLTVQ